jgi:hypothetical protein
MRRIASDRCGHGPVIESNELIFWQEQMEESQFSSITALDSEHTRLLESFSNLNEESLSEDFIVSIESFMNRAAAFGSRISVPSDRADAQAALTYWTSVLQRVNHSGGSSNTPQTVLARFDRDKIVREMGQKNPYKGLLAFQREDSEIFFGRRELIADMLDMLRNERRLALLGSSGSGKSSAVRAGLLPVLQDGGLPDAENWRYIGPFVPGDDPLTNLVDAVCPATETRERWRSAHLPNIRIDPGHLIAMLARGALPPILLIDQMEEIFTLSVSEGDQKTYLQSLAIAMEAGEMRLIVTMRSEFDTLLMQSPLGKMLVESRLRVPPLQTAGLRDAIVKPAERFGVAFDEEVVDSLVKNVQNEPAGLPLLQFGLLKLWQGRQQGRITASEYNELGGSPQQILVSAADAAFESLRLVEDQDRARQIFLSLIKPGDGLEVTARRRLRGDLSFIGPRDDVNRLLERIEAAGLIRTVAAAQPEKTLIELSHESLTRNWPKLSGWVRTDLPKLRRRQLLEETARQWKSSPDTITTYEGEQLREARDFPALNADEREFLAASAKVHRRRGWLRNLALYGLPTLVLVAAMILLKQDNARVVQVGKLRAEVQDVQDKVDQKGEDLKKREADLDNERRKLQGTQKDLADALLIIRQSVSSKPSMPLPPKGERTTIYVMIPAESEMDVARAMIDVLRARDPGYLLPGAQRLDPRLVYFPPKTQVRYFHPEDEERGKQIAGALKQFNIEPMPIVPEVKVNLDNVPLHHIEIWFATGQPTRR